MPRYALRIDYHGGPFAGWQRQAGGWLSVQGAGEAALAKLRLFGLHGRTFLRSGPGAETGKAESS